MDEKALFERLDRIILLLEKVGKEPSIMRKIADGLATGAGILGILSAVEIVRAWTRRLKNGFKHDMENCFNGCIANLQRLPFLRWKET